MASKKKWSERRELRRDRPFSTRDDSSVASGTSGPGRPTTRGRFSESWKRISSRGGSTKRGALNSQQPPVRCLEDTQMFPQRLINDLGAGREQERLSGSHLLGGS
ncbi:hypothetical protein CgunFtcFv8_004587 [Champsocephalus gunnari]|uniref:Uncharacterized protein n=1 Tax=Champsocephalus gunnari TaxID=52237 RepID=A0AAN8HYZ0_CHAGU|nr:hypothetical protein CgunFtcFv8_004587 [Champsocephalus gunnari]